MSNRYGLTEAEASVMDLISQGIPNKQIATQLGIKDNTVKAHCRAIFLRMRVSNRTEAALCWLGVDEMRDELARLRSEVAK